MKILKLIYVIIILDFFYVNTAHDLGLLFVKVLTAF